MAKHMWFVVMVLWFAFATHEFGFALEHDDVAAVDVAVQHVFSFVVV